MNKTLQPLQLFEDKFLGIWWDEGMRIIGIDWKEATSTMTEEEFRAELTIFAKYVEEKKAPAILVDVSRFRHQPAPDFQPWRVKNISNRYNTAGVKKEVFLFPKNAPIPPQMNQSAAGEEFLTRAFDDREQAVAWLTAKA